MNAHYAPPPKDLDDLWERARLLQGHTIEQLASPLGFALPASSRYGKGFGGRVIETILGAPCDSKSEPDFSELRVELKTLPVNPQGRVLEATYLCPIVFEDLSTFENSHVARQLQTILWVPILKPQRDSVADAQVLEPLLWSPSPRQIKIFSEDFEEIASLCCQGRLCELTARLGQSLHVRPKAAHGQVLQHWHDGLESSYTLPRGFYLRPQESQRILEGEGVWRR